MSFGPPPSLPSQRLGMAPPLCRVQISRAAQPKFWFKPRTLHASACVLLQSAWRCSLARRHLRRLQLERRRALERSVVVSFEMAELMALPCGDTPDEKQRRDAMWALMDEKGCGFVSLPELQGHLLRGVLPLPQRPILEPLLISALHAANQATTAEEGRLGDQFVERGREFARLLLCMRCYLELFALLARGGQSVDRKLGCEELEVRPIRPIRYSIIRSKLSSAAVEWRSS